MKNSKVRQINDEIHFQTQVLQKCRASKINLDNAYIMNFFEKINKFVETADSEEKNELA